MVALALIYVLCAALDWSGNAEVAKGIMHYMEPGTRYFNLEAPDDSILPQDIDRWARIMGASEAQHNFMDVMYQQFVERHNAFMDREATKYLELSAKLGSLYDSHGMDSDEYAAAGRALDRMRLTLHSGLEALQQELIGSFEHVLTPEQAERLVVVRRDASRRLCRAAYVPRVRWADIELREVWEQSAAEWATPDEVEAVEALLMDYEAMLTTLICRWDRLKVERRQRQRENGMALRNGTISPEEGRARSIRMAEERHATGAAVRDLNKQTVAQVADALSKALADGFVAAAKTAVFPEIYPDSTALHDLFQMLLADEEIDEGAGDEVVNQFNSYSIEYDRLATELEAFLEGWGEQSSRGVSGHQPQFLQRELSPLGLKRSDLSRTVLAQLDATIDGSWRERHAEGIPRSLRFADPEGDGEGAASTP